MKNYYCKNSKESVDRLLRNFCGCLSTGYLSVVRQLQYFFFISFLLFFFLFHRRFFSLCYNRSFWLFFSLSLFNHVPAALFFFFFVSSQIRSSCCPGEKKQIGYGGAREQESCFAWTVDFSQQPPKTFAKKFVRL